MKVTRLGPPRPAVSLNWYLGGASVGSNGQAPVSNGSNGVAWTTVINTISANSSNYALGPHVNFADGSNTTVSVASNTLRIHVSGITVDPADDTMAWMPLTSVASNTLQPELVWDGDDSLIPTLVPI